MQRAAPPGRPEPMRALSLSGMHEQAEPSLASRRAAWFAAAGFWLFVAAMSIAQTFWLARTPGPRASARSSRSPQAISA
jgi:hypothetical protein